MLHAVLKALNNRRFIYTVNLSDNYHNYKAREKAQKEAEGKTEKWEYCAV